MTLTTRVVYMSTSVVMKKVPTISIAEWEIMEVIWERPSLTASEISARFGGRGGWKPTTVKTLLARLVKKRALAFVERGREYVYRPLVAREECIRAASRSFLDRLFGGSLVPMVAQFVENGVLTPSEIAELRAVLERGNHGERERSKRKAKGT